MRSRRRQEGVAAKVHAQQSKVVPGTNFEQTSRSHRRRRVARNVQSELPEVRHENPVTRRVAVDGSERLGNRTLARVLPTRLRLIQTSTRAFELRATEDAVGCSSKEPEREVVEASWPGGVFWQQMKDRLIVREQGPIAKDSSDQLLVER